MKLAFRVDASAEIGTGHLRRCLSLAHALRMVGATPAFVFRDLGSPVADLVRAEGFESRPLPPPPASATQDEGDAVPHAAWSPASNSVDAHQTVERLEAWRPDWIVIDHYSFDARWHRQAAAALACRIAVIDDLGDRALQANVLIDHNFSLDHARKYEGRLAAGTPMLVGPQHALLGPAYSEAPRHVVKDEVSSIGIFMGGADQAGYSRMALQACRETLGLDCDIEIVSTSANPGLERLRDAVAASPRTRLTLDLPDLAAFFARHDLHIGAGGGATWERCCIGAPTLALIAADNQRMVLKPLEGMGVLLTVDSQPPNQAAVAAGTRSLLGDARARRAMSERARRLVDGRGAFRVAEHLIRS